MFNEINEDNKETICQIIREKNLQNSKDIYATKKKLTLIKSMFKFNNF